jgi:hypothetical protein
MSDTDMVDAAPEEPPKVKPTPKGRGRGRKRGVAKGRVQKAPLKKAAATGRRGRLKQFSDTRIQANYERQRELKAHFASVAAILKPALQDLAERNVDKIIEDPDYHKHKAEYPAIIAALDKKRNDTLRHAETHHNLEVRAANRVLDYELHVNNQSFEVNTLFYLFLPSDSFCLPFFARLAPSSSFQKADTMQHAVDDDEDLVLDGMLARLDRLEFLHDHNLPVDVSVLV